MAGCPWSGAAPRRDRLGPGGSHGMARLRCSRCVWRGVRLHSRSGDERPAPVRRLVHRCRSGLCECGCGAGGPVSQPSFAAACSSPGRRQAAWPKTRVALSGTRCAIRRSGGPSESAGAVLRGLRRGRRSSRVARVGGGGSSGRPGRGGGGAAGCPGADHVMEAVIGTVRALLVRRLVVRVRSLRYADLVPGNVRGRPGRCRAGGSS